MSGSMMGTSRFDAGMGILGGIIMFITILILGFISIFIGSAILHIGVYIVGGKKGYSQTAKAVIYGLTPNLLFGWIPFIGIIGGIWALIIQIIGIRQLHEITTEKAILAVFVPIIISIIVATILAAVIAAFVFGM